MAKPSLDYAPKPQLPVAGPQTPPPKLSAIVKRLGANMLYAMIVPGILFYVFLVTVSTGAAIIAALAWCYSGILFRKVTGRRMSGLLVLTMLVMTARSIVALVTGGTFFYFLQPIITDTVIATVFFVSLATARPVVARLAADFFPMTLEIARNPRVKRLLWRLTLLWATVCLVKAGITFYLLQSTSVVNFVLLKNIAIIVVTLSTVTLTVWASARVARREGLLHTA